MYELTLLNGGSNYDGGESRQHWAAAVLLLLSTHKRSARVSGYRFQYFVVCRRRSERAEAWNLVVVARTVIAQACLTRGAQRLTL